MGCGRRSRRWPKPRVQTGCCDWAARHCRAARAACLFSENRAKIRLRTVLGGSALQFVLAVVLIDFPRSRHVMLGLNRAVDTLQLATDAGTGLVFG